MPLQAVPQPSTRTAVIHNALCERQERLLVILSKLVDSLDRLNGPGVQADPSKETETRSGVLNEIEIVLADMSNTISQIEACVNSVEAI